MKYERCGNSVYRVNDDGTREKLKKRSTKKAELSWKKTCGTCAHFAECVVLSSIMFGREMKYADIERASGRKGCSRYSNIVEAYENDVINK